MGDKNASQVQQAGDFWKAFVDEQVSKAGSVVEELAKLETKALEQTRTAIDEMARLGKESLAWSAELSAGWRRMTLEAARRATGMIAR